jgi:hypothetical protein
LATDIVAIAQKSGYRNVFLLIIYISVLPTYRGEVVTSALPANEVTKVALKLKYQIEQVICIELDESSITNANSSVITKDVVATARNAGGEEFKACVIYCLLVCVRWFKIQSRLEVGQKGLPVRFKLRLTSYR